MTESRPSPGDPGLEAVERIHREMQIDDEWSVRQERTFTWWGAWLRQRVWAGEAAHTDGTTRWHVRARTPALRDQPDDASTYAFVNDANALTALSAYAYDPADGTV